MVIIMRTWSVELEVTDYSDDTFTGSYEECVEYIRNNYSDTEDDYQIAEIEVEDGCTTYTYEVIKKDSIEL